MDELISRQAAIDAAIKADMENNGGILSEKRARVFDAHISRVPPVQPKRGHWKCSDDVYEYAVCSCCGWDTEEDWEYIEKHFKFCPNCGGDMRGNENGTD